MLHGQRGSLPQPILQATRLESGAIPTAMQWKKAAAFALANPEASDFLDWLTGLPEGLEKVNLATFSDNSRPASALYVLFGWSNSGADELRRARMDSVTVTGREIDIYVSRPQVEASFSLMGTADMRFIGWEIPLATLPPGIKHQARMHVRRDTIRISGKPPYEETIEAGGGYEKAGEIEFKKSRAD